MSCRHGVVRVVCTSLLLATFGSPMIEKLIKGQMSASSQPSLKRFRGSTCPPTLDYCREVAKRKAQRAEDAANAKDEHRAMRKAERAAAEQRILDEITAKQRARDREAEQGLERKARMEELRKRQRDSGWDPLVESEIEAIAAADKAHRLKLAAPTVPPRAAFSSDRLGPAGLAQAAALVRQSRALELAAKLEKLPPGGPKRHSWEDGLVGDYRAASPLEDPEPLELLLPADIRAHRDKVFEAKYGPVPSNNGAKNKWGQKHGARRLLRQQRRALFVADGSSGGGPAAGVGGGVAGGAAGGTAGGGVRRSLLAPRSSCPPQLAMCLEAEQRKRSARARAAGGGLAAATTSGSGGGSDGFAPAVSGAVARMAEEAALLAVEQSFEAAAAAASKRAAAASNKEARQQEAFEAAAAQELRKMSADERNAAVLKAFVQRKRVEHSSNSLRRGARREALEELSEARDNVLGVPRAFAGGGGGRGVDGGEQGFGSGFDNIFRSGGGGSPPAGLLHPKDALRKTDGAKDGAKDLPRDPFARKAALEPVRLGLNAILVRKALEANKLEAAQVSESADRMRRKGIGRSHGCCSRRHSRGHKEREDEEDEELLSDNYALFSRLCPELARLYIEISPHQHVFTCTVCPILLFPSCARSFVVYAPRAHRVPRLCMRWRGYGQDRCGRGQGRRGEPGPRTGAAPCLARGRGGPRHARAPTRAPAKEGAGLARGARRGHRTAAGRAAGGANRGASWGASGDRRGGRLVTRQQ